MNIRSTTDILEGDGKAASLFFASKEEQMNLFKMLPLAILFATGCATDIGPVKDVDPELDELKRLGEGVMLYEDTPPFLTIADKKGIMIFAEKNEKTFQTNDPGVRQARWAIKVLNDNNIGRCIAIEFRLLDFIYVSDHPSEFFVPANSAMIAGTMKQKVWTIGGVQFVPPSSGYVRKMNIRDPVIDANIGEECDFAIEDAVEDDDTDTMFFSLF